MEVLLVQIVLLGAHACTKPVQDAAPAIQVLAMSTVYFLLKSTAIPGVKMSRFGMTSAEISSQTSRSRRCRSFDALCCQRRRRRRCWGRNSAVLAANRPSGLDECANQIRAGFNAPAQNLG